MIDDDVREALLVEVYRLIEETASKAINALDGSRSLVYPPASGSQDGLTPEEQQAATSLSPAARSALRKVIADAMSTAFFGFFCVLDGVGEPQGWSGDTWLGVDLTTPKAGEYRPMLHDELYESYWAFAMSRKST